MVIQLNTANLIGIMFGKSSSLFQTSREYKFHTDIPTSNKRTSASRCPRVASDDMMGEQLHCSNP